MKKIILLILLFPSLVFAGTAYYVDLDAGSSGTGTYASPWNKISDVEGAGLSAGDDVYFKHGTSNADGNQEDFDVTWASSKEDPVVIGCYDGDGDFDCTGRTLPIIDGDTHNIGLVDIYDSLIMINGSNGASGGYYTVQDLDFRNSGWNAVTIDDCGDYNTIQRCKADYQNGNTFVLSEVQHSTVDNNTVTRSSYGGQRRNHPDYCYAGDGDNCSDSEACPYGCWGWGGAAITVIDGNNNETGTLYNTVSNNSVSGGYEGIGAYMGGSYTIIENNKVFDNRSYHIYMGNSTHNIVRGNLVFESDADPDNNDAGIFIGCESWESWPLKVNGSNEVYNNFVVGMRWGITMTSSCYETSSEAPVSNNKVYNNTIIDCTEYNIRLAKTGGASGNVIKNNISWILNRGGSHITGCSDGSVTWADNLWDTDPGSGGCDSGTDPANEDPQLSKTNWSSITTSLDETDFHFTSSGSPGVGDGGDLGDGCVDWSGYCDQDYLGTDRDPTWDCGGYQLTASGDKVVTITASDDTATESGPTTGEFTISCSPNCASESINWSLSGSSATIDTDYNMDDEDGVSSFSGASTTITVTPVDDDDIENNETVLITLQTGTGYTIGSPSSAYVTIVSDDVADVSNTISFDGSTTFTQGGSNTLDFTD